MIHDVTFRSFKRRECHTEDHERHIEASVEMGTYRNNHRAGPRTQFLILIQVLVRADALKLTSESKGIGRLEMASQIIKPSLELPFEFTRLARPTGHVLQFEHGPEDIGDNLGHQFCA